MLDSKSTKNVHPDIGISDGANNGKYWSRHLINGAPMQLEPGDRFEERTAYVLFPSSKDEPLRDFFDWRKQIRSKFPATEDLK